MLFKKTFAFYCKCYTNHVTVPCGKNAVHYSANVGIATW